MKNTVIYHSADFDGLFCREIARKFLPADTEFIGWNFGDAPVPFREGPIYVLDLPVDQVFGFKFQPAHEIPIALGDIIWIDHHKSSIETHPTSLRGYRIDGVAACRLAWQWFAISEHNAQHSTSEALQIPLPDKAAFINRAVSEPLAVRLAGEYDIWDKRDDRAELFQHGLRSRDLQDWWVHLLDLDPTVPAVEVLLEAGKSLQFVRTRENESIVKELGFTFQWEGLTWLACNAARYNSLLFTAGLKPEHDACFGFKWTGKEWSVSLYHAPGHEQHDLSAIAKKFGGGGHRGACGFQTKVLPCLPAPKVPPLDNLVNAFLACPLPETVSVDYCALNPGGLNRTGTNLLTAVEAAQMFEQVLAKASCLPSAGAEPWKSLVQRFVGASAPDELRGMAEILKQSPAPEEDKKLALESIAALLSDALSDLDCGNAEVGRSGKWRKKPVVIEATQWFKNGDHPADNVFRPFEDTGKLPVEPREGEVVRYYRHPEVAGDARCKHCSHTMHNHGWIDTLEGGHIVCPGDYVITGVKGERYPCKPEIFAATYDAA